MNGGLGANEYYKSAAPFLYPPASNSAFKQKKQSFRELTFHFQKISNKSARKIFVIVGISNYSNPFPKTLDLDCTWRRHLELRIARQVQPWTGSTQAMQQSDRGWRRHTGKGSRKFDETRIIDVSPHFPEP